MRYLIPFLFLFRLHAAITGVAVSGITHRQAVLKYTAPSNNACTVQVSQSNTLTPPVYDVDPTLFAGANSDARDTSLHNDRNRVFVAGQPSTGKALNGKIYSRSLEAAVTHYYQINCDSDVVAGSFVTRNLPDGATAPEVPVFHPDGFGNYGWPTIDWNNRAATYVDPMSGLRLKLGTGPGDWGGKSVGNFHPDMYADPNSAWTNRANIVVGSTSSLASTTTASAPIFAGMGANFFPPGQNGGFFPTTSTDDFGITVYGFGTDASATNRTVQVCISVDSGVSCYTDPIDVVLPQNSAAQMPIVPSVYPKAGFGGWSKLVRREYLPTIGRVVVASGVVTLVKNLFGGTLDTTSYFLANWAPGTKIWISGSSPTCPNNLCTVASVQSQTQLTLFETGFTSAETEYRAANFGARITKKTGTGSVSVSSSFDAAWSYGFGLPPLGSTDQCGRSTVTATVDADGNTLPGGQTLKGYLCVFPTIAGSAGLFFFAPDTGEMRFLSLFRTPDSIPGHVSGDLPNPVVYAGPPTANFDPDTPNVIVISSNTISGKQSLFRITYTGDYRTLRYNYPPSYTAPASPADNMVWQNITKPSQGKDLQTQVDQKFPAFDKTKFGDLSNVSGRSVSGHYMGFVKNTGTQDSPCWIFLVNVQTGTVETGFNTYDGAVHPWMRWMGCHYADGTSIPDYLTINGNVLQGGNTNSLYHGPFQTLVSSVKKAGVFSTNTSIPYPIDNTYDNTCPADLAVKYQNQGAIGNRCITMRVQGEPCNRFPTSQEVTWSPCPYDSAQSMLQPIQEGDIVTDVAPLPGVNSERLRVVRKTVNGSVLELVLQRNVADIFCNIPASNQIQGVHLNGWTLTMAPGNPNNCDTGIYYLNGVTKDLFIENRILIGGHFDLGTSPDPNSYTLAGSGYFIRYSRGQDGFGQPYDYLINASATFDGAEPFPAATSSYLQSYGSLRQWNAPVSERRWILDFRHFNGPFGVGQEFIGVNIGPPVTVQPVAGTTQTYKVSIIGTVDYKRLPLVAFAGRNLLLEKSSPKVGNTLTDADTWRFCYAYKAGECRSGSSQGDAYANIPQVSMAGFCYVGQNTVNTPCIVSDHPFAASTIQLDVSKPNGVGSNFRKLSMGFSGPGRQYSFSNMRALPDAKWAFMPGMWLDGLRQDMLAVKLTPYNLTDSTSRATFVPVNLKMPTFPGAVSAVVDFGYAQFGQPSEFRCTARQESCVANQASIASVSSPFAYASEVTSGVACSSGCTVPVPGIAGRIMHYRYRFLDANGVTIHGSNIQTVAVW